MIRQASKAWHGVKLNQSDWGDDSHSLAFEAKLRRENLDVYVILNAYWEPLEFELPPTAAGGTASWRRWIDTDLDSPQDIVPWHVAAPVSAQLYRAAARSVAVLVAAAD